MFITILLSLWIVASLCMILVILLQRGRGGGLVGVLGAGGSSAFGAKAGDVFTRITVGIFGCWLLLAMILVWAMKIPPKFV